MKEYIINYFLEQNLPEYKNSLEYLLSFLPNKSVSSIFNKIKKNYNNPSYVQKYVNSYYSLYSQKIPLKKIRKRENKVPKTTLERQKKYLETTNKIKFQCMISKELKNKLEELKKDKKITFEQLLNDAFL